MHKHILALTLCLAATSIASAQGLVGPPVDPVRYSQTVTRNDNAVNKADKKVMTGTRATTNPTSDPVVAPKKQAPKQ